MALLDQPYTVRMVGPDLMVRGVDHQLRVQVWRDHTIHAPTGTPTVSVYDPTGTAVVDGATATVAGDGTVTYTVTAATTAALTLGEGWRVEWGLTLSDGTELRPVNDGALVRKALYPVIACSDLYARDKRLDPDGLAPVDVVHHHQAQIDQAWQDLMDMLLEKGNRPNLVMSPYTFRRYLLFHALELCFRPLAKLDNDYGEVANSYRDDAIAAWDSVKFLYDSDDDGVVDDPHRRRSGTSTLWLSGR